ncbi:MAG: hypothetical protein R3322_00285 [Kiloniellales bacterium]|nr:hypothetical protein [Kiloniellales bacterium]
MNDYFTIRDDVAHPSDSELRGTEGKHDLTRNARLHPRIRYRDRVSEADLYDQAGRLLMHFFCPKCGQPLKVETPQKNLRVREGKISMDSFRCSWDGCGLHARVVDNLMVDVT